MKISHNINNLSGGITNQHKSWRKDTQVSDMVNFIPSLAHGAIKRNPIKYWSDIPSDLINPENFYFHKFENSNKENFLVVLSCKQQLIGSLDDIDIKIIDESKNVYDVHINDNDTRDYLRTLNTNSYWNNVKDRTQMISVGDTTWVLNKSKTIESIKSSSVAEPKTAYYWIKRSTEIRYGENASSSKGYTYEVSCDSWTVSRNETSTIDAINNLNTDINSNADVSSTIIGGQLIKITFDNQSDYDSFVSGDSYGNQASIGFTTTVKDLKDLPSELNGYTGSLVVEIASAKNSDNAYYVSWNGKKWEEVASPYYDKGQVDIGINNETFIVKLVNYKDLGGNNKFAIGLIGRDYSSVVVSGVNLGQFFEDELFIRKSGNEVNNPVPSFINQTISNVFFYRNRLCFSSEESVIMSEVGEYYNFFTKTARDVLDTDMIDVMVDSTKYAKIEYVSQIDNKVILWCNDDGQYAIDSRDVLTPTTVTIHKVSSYAFSRRKPLVIDTGIFFTQDTGTGGYVKALLFGSTQDKNTAVELNRHCDKLIPREYSKSDNIKKIIASLENNIVFILDSNNTIYCYKYAEDTKETLQSSWFKIVYGSAYNVNNILVFNNNLYIFTQNWIYNMDLGSHAPTDYIDDSHETPAIPFEAYIELNHWNIPTPSGSQEIVDKFFLRTMTVGTDDNNSKVDIEVNNNRGIKTIKDSTRKKWTSFIGSETDILTVKLKANYDNKCVINTINLQGEVYTNGYHNTIKKV